ncbi:MAG TPA: TIGR03118 family protein [Casimicrobiaceae bacterium]|nr:TIGR03118 family protein [Casimicrobiaceae bacterium]
MPATSPLARAAKRLAVVACAVAFSAPALADPGNYDVTKLVADVAGVAANTDTNLVNGWGIAMRATSPIWVSNNGTGTSTLYNGLGVQVSPPSPVLIPAASGSGQGVPTGITSNPSTSDFLLGGPGTAAIFLWATEDGAIAAWNGGPAATIKFAAKDGAVYKGLALAGNGSSFRLYAADFHNGKIDVLDNTFTPTSVAGGFVDPRIPAGFAPFNVMNLQGNLYVSYALREQGGNDEVAGVGLGFVDVFDADGFLVARAATRGKLNAPWGMAIAPAGFGKFSNHLLVGNFGDGTINAYDVKTFTFAGQLHAANGRTLVIDGLWGIAFGNGFQRQPTDALFFAAGPDDESHGLYGRIDPAP